MKQVLINLLTRKFIAFLLSLIATFLLTLWDKLPAESFSFLLPTILGLLVASNVAKSFISKPDAFTKGT